MSVSLPRRLLQMSGSRRTPGNSKLPILPLQGQVLPHRTLPHQPSGLPNAPPSLPRAAQERGKRTAGSDTPRHRVSSCPAASAGQGSRLSRQEPPPYLGKEGRGVHENRPRREPRATGAADKSPRPGGGRAHVVDTRVSATPGHLLLLAASRGRAPCSSPSLQC